MRESCWCSIARDTSSWNTCRMTQPSVTTHTIMQAWITWSLSSWFRVSRYSPSSWPRNVDVNCISTSSVVCQIPSTRPEMMFGSELRHSSWLVSLSRTLISIDPLINQLIKFRTQPLISKLLIFRHKLCSLWLAKDHIPVGAHLTCLHHNQFYQSVYWQNASPQHFLFWTAGHESSWNPQDSGHITIIVHPTLAVMILFPYCSILLIVHSCHLLTWRGSVRFLNDAYLLVRSSSTFSLVSLSLDVPIS